MVSKIQFFLFFKISVKNPNTKTTLILSGNELDEKGVAVIKDFTEKRKYTIIYWHTFNFISCTKPKIRIFKLFILDVQILISSSYYFFYIIYWAIIDFAWYVQTSIKKNFQFSPSKREKGKTTVNVCVSAKRRIFTTKL